MRASQQLRGGITFTLVHDPMSRGLRVGGHRKRDIADLARVDVEAFGQRVEVLAIFALAVLPASGFLKEYCCQLFVSSAKDLVLDHPPPSRR